ncbi:Outer membrane protein assembly factor BamB, contains PQQ-like beta-propeller repeat [Tangfeifania diversioriginum]|uniref:Outer membrane protein assembly factor BamB, contains PQQ-like beta-propeller repeat n=1 Tax=Tangfeifania diversioriginum TaxID=1168035 RepID=A0A1M6FQQ9_9BACT|nr:PQQ-binding-like beta-propeller repeat protein [Tangfeifania diversioriginum]SHJ00040.1 Outer membrane protein assembly factor BamB, contains PQQ-like beta-propeller repeat [Tangfeifania diversioriginum]
MRKILLLCAVVLLFSCSQQKSKIYQWRGENRTGVFQEENLLNEWPENGPAEIWFAEGIGNGYGSPTVTESELFITGEIDSLAWMFCYDLNGELKWKQSYGKEWAKHYPGSRSAPTVVGNMIYVNSGAGTISCLDRENGTLIWQKDYVEDFNAIFPMHGFSEAPVVSGNKVFCTPGGKEHNVVALDRFSGDVVWSCKGMSERMGYNPGNIIELPNRKIYVTFSAYHMLGIDAETGELLWTQLQDNTPVDKREQGVGDTHSNNVIFEDGFIYYAVGDGNRGVKLQLSEDGSEITEIWRTTDLDTYMGGFVKLGDYIYGCGTRKKDLKSFDAETGQPVDSLKAGTGAIVAADNMLYYYNWRGELSLLSCENGKLQKQSSFKMTRGSKEHFSHPVIKNGVLYQRRGDALMAFDIRVK